MYNKLFSIGPVTVYGYGLMIGIGILCAFLVAYIRAKKQGLDPEIVFGLGIAGLFGGVIGAKLLFCLIEIKAFLANPLMFLASEGFVVYGGIIADDQQA